MCELQCKKLSGFSQSDFCQVLWSGFYQDFIPCILSSIIEVVSIKNLDK